MRKYLVIVTSGSRQPTTRRWAVMALPQWIGYYYRFQTRGNADVSLKMRMMVLILACQPCAGISSRRDYPGGKPSLTCWMSLSSCRSSCTNTGCFMGINSWNWLSRDSKNWPAPAKKSQILKEYRLRQRLIWCRFIWLVKKWIILIIMRSWSHDYKISSRIYKIKCLFYLIQWMQCSVISCILRGKNKNSQEAYFQEDFQAQVKWSSSLLKSAARPVRIQQHSGTVVTSLSPNMDVSCPAKFGDMSLTHPR